VGPLLFSARSTAIWISSTHFSISSRELKTDMGVSSSRHSRPKVNVQEVRFGVTWRPRQWTAAGLGGSGSGAPPTRPRSSRSVGQELTVIGNWQARHSECPRTVTGLVIGPPKARTRAGPRAPAEGEGAPRQNLKERLFFTSPGGWYKQGSYL
jgi:hypothetical protein